MKIKATKKVLSLVLVVMMLMSTFAMMFAYADAPAADEPVTTPKAYADAEDGEKLYDVDFSSEYWTPVDESTYDNNGTSYDATGKPVATGYVGGWIKSLATNAKVIEEDGAALKIDGKVPAVGTEGEDGYVAEIPADATTTDSRYVGQINAYDLENKTLTLEFEYFRKGVTRSKFYFANGAFMTDGYQVDYKMVNLGIELSASQYRFMRQSQGLTYFGKPVYTDNEAGEKTAKMKVVLEGGSILEDIIIYNGTDQTLTSTEEVAYWQGDAIPVTVTVYNTIINGEGKEQDIRARTVDVYQPADLDLVFGIGEYNALKDNEYYGVRDVAIYKGDTSVPFDFGFTHVYNEEAKYGDDLTKFDAKGITFDDYNNANGYEWAVNGGGIVVDNEGVVFVNRTDKATTSGAFTPHPFGEEWNQGYYEMELCVNNAGRLKIGVITSGAQERVGFDILPNGSVASLTNEDGAGGDATAYLTASNAAKIYVSAGNGFGTGLINAGGLKTIVYDTYVEDDKTEMFDNPDFDATQPESAENPKQIGGDGIPEDPRNVRDYSGSRANVKIAYDCENYMITLYEKCTVDGESQWLPTAAIDYSEAIEMGLEPSLVLDFYAWDMNVNATIKNIKVKKGLSATHLHSFKIGELETPILTAYNEDVLAELTEGYADMYGLWNVDFGWTADGETVLEDYKAIYDEILDTYYGETAIKLAPIVNYETLATDAVLRGVRVSTNEDGTYDVDFVAAIGDTSNVAAIGYDIVKTVNYGGYVKETKTSVETNKVLGSINANGLVYSASALGGEHAVAIGLEDEAALENAVVSYAVTVYTIALDGTKTVSNETVTYTFYNGEYMGW